MHITLMKTLFKLAGYLTFSLIAINICALMNKYVFVDKVLSNIVLTFKASLVELINFSILCYLHGKGYNISYEAKIKIVFFFVLVILLYLLFLIPRLTVVLENLPDAIGNQGL